MQTKEKLPKDVYQATLWVIRGHKRRIKEYNKQKDDILNSGGATYIKTKNKFSNEWEYIYLPKSKTTQSSTEVKGMALAMLDQADDTKKIIIVQQALKEVAAGYNGCADMISNALMKNIENRHDYPYRNLGNLPLSEKQFYALKSRFIYSVAIKLKLI